MAEELKPVNLPFTVPDLVGPTVLPQAPAMNDQAGYTDIFNSLLNQAAPKTGQDLPSVATSGIDMSGRYPKFFVGMNNEELYAQNQGVAEKAFNGVTKMAGIATSTFINGTVGTFYGITKAIQDGKFSSFYDNNLTRELNDWTEGLENSYAHYKTEREKNGNWWEPSNLLTANFFFDNIVKNLGFMAGAAGAGFAWGAALKAIGLTGRLTGLGAKWAGEADSIVSEAASLPQAERIAAVNSRLNSTLQSAKVQAGKALMKSDRAIVATTATMGEAGLEALNNSKEFRQSAIQEFKDKYGYSPEGEDLERINKASESVGNFSFFANSALLSATNYIQLPKIFSSSFKAEKNIMNGVTRAGAEYVESLPQKGFGKFMYQTKNVGSLFFNTAEAFEEGAQYAIQTGTQNYFGRKAKGEDTDVLRDAVGYGIKEALTTDEGTLNIFTGGFSGALMSSGVVGFRDGKPVIGQTGKIGERGVTGYGGEDAKLRDELIPAFNNSTIRKRLIQANNNVAAAESIQQDKKAAVLGNDKLEAKDLEFDYTHNFIDTRLKYNAKSAIDDEIADLKNEAMTDEGFAKLQQEGITAETDTKESFIARLDRVQQQANDTAKLYDAVNLKYKGVIDSETKKPKYSDEVLDMLVYNSAKMADYNRRIPQLEGVLAKAQIPTTEFIADIIENATPGKPLPKSAEQMFLDIYKQIDKMKVVKGVKDDLKQDVFDMAELALRRKHALTEYDRILENPQEYSYEALTSPDYVAKVKQLSAQEGKKTETKELEVGREYSLAQPVTKTGSKLNLAPKIKVLEKGLGGQYKVQLPNGEVTFLKPGEFKDYNIIDSSNDSQEFADILEGAINTVLKRSPYKNLEAPKEGRLNWVNSLGNQKLVDDIEAVFNNRASKFMTEMAKSQYKRDQLVNSAGELQQGQQDFEANSGEFPTGTEPDESLNPDSLRKETSELFTSTTLPSAQSKDTTEDKLPNFVIRYNTFINKVRSLPKQGNLRMILVTANDLANYGLTGLTEIAYEKKPGQSLTEKELADSKTTSHGFVAAVFVEQDGNTLHYVDVNGNRIGTPKKGVDASQVVFATMPTTDLTWQDGKTPRYREGESLLAKQFQGAWAEYRKELFNKPYTGSGPITAFTFNISNGFPITISGKVQKNPVGEVLQMDDATIASTKGLVKISTLGTITHTDGKTYKFAKGRTVLSYGDVLQYLQNSRFSAKQAKTIFEVIKGFSNAIKSDIDAKRNIQLKNQYSEFLQNVLFWKKSTSPTANQIFLNEETGKLHIGKNSYDLIDIEKAENEIINELQAVSFSANNTTLNADTKFYEFYYEGGQLKEREWKNYQAYLLSAKNPDGSARETPLTLNVSVPTASVPYAFTQKYASLSIPLTFPAETTVQEVIPTVPASPVGAAPVVLTSTSPATDVVKARLSQIIDAKVQAGQYPSEVGYTGVLETSEGPVNFILTEDGVVITASDAVTNLANNKEKYNGMRKDLGLEPAIEAEQEAVAEEVATEEVPATVEEEAPISPIGITPGSLKNRKNSFRPNTRKVGRTAGQSMTAEDEEVFKAWAKKNLPKMKYEYLDNLIKTNDGGLAYGQMINGLVQIAKGGLKGTEFHEAMEYVWNGLLSPEQREAILEEFRAQEGTFVDRETGVEYAYNDENVSNLMAKERIMDNFADYMVNKVSDKSLTDKILDFFKAIAEFIKALVSKPSLQQELFDAVNAGKFADKIYSADQDVLAYSRVAGIDAQLTYEFVEDIKASFYLGMYQTKQDLFNMSERNANDIFNQIIQDYKDSNIGLTDAQYKDLVSATKDSLRSDNFDFTDDNDVSINGEGVTNRNYAADAFSVDFKKSAPYAVKILSSSLIRTTGEPLTSPTQAPEYQYSPTLGGMMLIPYNEVYVTLTNKLSNTLDKNDFIAKLYDLAKTNPDYVQLFEALGGNMQTRTIDFSKYSTDSDMRLFVSFMQQYTKQSPEILVQYLRDGNRYTAPANLSKASQQVEQDWINNIIVLANTSGSIIKYDKGNYVLKSEAPLSAPSTQADQLNFLKSVGITFDKKSYDRLSKEKKVKFGEYVQQVYTDLTSDTILQLKREKGTVTRTIGSGLINLASLYASVNSINLESVTYNAEGKQQQIYTDSNAPSVFEYHFNSVKNINELFERMPQMRDVFSKGSQVLKLGGRFFKENGDRTDAKLLVKTINGEIDTNNDKGKAISDLNIGTRYITEINQNLEGNYYILIPADGSTEWMMNLGNVIDYKNFTTGRWKNDVLSIFTNYFIDDIKLARDSANRQKLDNMQGKEKDLRFFEGFLADPKYKTLLDSTKALINRKSATDKQIQEFADKNATMIREAVVDYIESVSKKTIDNLITTNDIVETLNGNYSFAGLNKNFTTRKGVLLNKEDLTRDELEDVINYTTANYVINNIEYFKILFGDPLQFEVKTKNNKTILDVTKRIKSFLSPRRITVNFDELNNYYTKARNVVDGVKVEEGELGYHEYKGYARTITAKNMIIAGKFYSTLGITDTDEADAASWLNPNTYREVKDKNGQWTPEAEAFHQWQMAYARQKISGYKYKSDALKAKDAELIKKRCPEYFIDVLKPIVSGSKDGKNYIDLVLDKYSQLPLYYQAVEGTNLEKLFVRMLTDNIDYIVVKSGRKVGAEGLRDLYNADGTFNNETFTNTVDVPWSAYGIQVENSYNKPKGQRLGSQPTKVVTLDMYENGVPVSEEAETAVQAHTDALTALYENGVDNIMQELGIVDTGRNFVIQDKSVVANTLRQEMLKQEMSDNALATLTINPDTKDFEIPFEASTNYIQIKRIIYSMVERRISSPTMSGNSAVQVPVTMWENASQGRSLIRKVGKTWETISREDYNKLSDEDKSSVMLSDDTLKFYQDADGLRYCEVKIPLPAHVAKLFKGKNEKQILKYLNDNLEESLMGVGFRIPTQGLNSMERIKIAGFLPAFMGNTVVVPSEITTKAGSDFDIDKLNMYIKSIYTDIDGSIHLYEMKGDEVATKRFYGDLFDRLIEKEQNEIVNELLKDSTYIDTEREKTLNDKFKSLELKKATREDFERVAYRKALENNYYKAIDTLLGMELNFHRLTAVNTNKNLMDLADTMDTLRSEDESTIQNRVLDRNYMTNQRNSFMMGKAWVGIVAQHITGHSNGQKAGLYVDNEGFTLSLPHNKLGKYVSVSGITDSDGKYISDNLSEYINAIVDIAKDPYIMKLIYSGQIVDLAMFLTRAGVSPKNTAMFLSQPIIREFVQTADNNDKKLSSLILNADVISKMQEKFPATELAKQTVGNKFNVDELEGNIERYATGDEFSDEQNAQQQLIFNEFVSSLKAANGLSEITQSTNIDTSNIRSAEQLTRKQLKSELQMTKEDPAVIKVSSSKKVMEATHLNALDKAFTKVNIALGTLFKFNRGDFREFIDSIINQYGENKYLSKDKYDQISEQLSASLLDYIIQSNKDFFVGKLTSGSSSVAAKLEAALKKYPTSQLLKDLKVIPGSRKEAPVTIKLAVSKLDASEENAYTDMMRGLRDNPETNDLYNDLVNLSIIQGTYRTPASIKKIIPLEDYAAIVTDLVKATEYVDKNVQNFKDNNMFQRNNFNNTDIVPKVTPLAFRDDKYIDFDIDGNELSRYSFVTGKSKEFFLLGAKAIGAGAQLITIDRVQNVNGVQVDFADGKSISPKQFALASKSDDNIYKYVFGYQLVKNPVTKEPIIYLDPKYGKQYIYKAVNLYGDGRYTTEYPGAPVPSKLKNGTIPVMTELDDQTIIDTYTGNTNTNVVKDVTEVADLPNETFTELTPEEPTVNPFTSTETVVQMQPQNVDKILNGTKTTTIRASIEKGGNIPVGETKIINFGGKDFNVTNRGYLTIDEAGGKEAMLKSEGVNNESELMYNQSRDWMNGKGKMYVYDITPTSEQTPVVETTPTENVITYGGKNFIIEGLPEMGSATVFFAKNDGTRGAELTSDKPLYRKVLVALYEQDRPEDVVELTELQGSPKYLLAMDGRVVSLNPTSYGDEIVSEDILNRIQAKLEEKQNASVESLTPTDIEVKPTSTFSYDGKTIDTDFTLTEQQNAALKTLVDFSKDTAKKVITLKGYAGTGKTATIGYLQKFLGPAYKFHYMAPTHAATVELAFATVRTGNRELPMTVAKAVKNVINPVTKQQTQEFSKDMTKRMGLGNNILVIDEVSMLNKSDYAAVLSAARAKNVKIIFMGDPAQIPEVDPTNPTNKQISKAFSEHEQVELTEVKRTNDDNILRVLTAVRNNLNNKIPKVPNTETLQYLGINNFNTLLANMVAENPENSVLISYTNSAAKEYNAKIRESLGRTGNLQADDIIVGFGGYNSKQIEKQNIANSVRYTVKEVKKDGSVYRIKASSERLLTLEKLGLKGVNSFAYGSYYQLSNDDSFKFDDLTQADFDNNNKELSRSLQQLYRAKSVAIENGSGPAWAAFYAKLDSVRSIFQEINLGGDYIYNPATNQMEKFNSREHGELARRFSELKVEKGIDFGHAVTIHKSQGSTVTNVFFDANSLPKGETSKLYEGDKFVGTEKQSLIYVGLSRASNMLAVSDDLSENFYNLEGYDGSENLSPKTTVQVAQGMRYMRLVDGQMYDVSEINAEMLEKMGYANPEVIGNILKQANGC
jgi:hypothetical protein